MNRHRSDAVAMGFGLIFALVAGLGFGDVLDDGGDVAAGLIPGVIVIAAISIVVGTLTRYRSPRTARPTTEASTPSKPGEVPAMNIDTELVDPWRGYVVRADRTRQRFHEAATGAPAGDIHDGLATIATHVDTGVEEVASAAAGAQALARAGGWHEEATATVGTAVDDAGRTLRQLSDRLDEAASRAVELAAGRGDETELRRLSRDVFDIVEEVGALRTRVQDAASLR